MVYLLQGKLKHAAVRVEPHTSVSPTGVRPPLGTSACKPCQNKHLFYEEQKQLCFHTVAKISYPK